MLSLSPNPIYLRTLSKPHPNLECILDDDRLPGTCWRSDMREVELLENKGSQAETLLAGLPYLLPGGLWFIFFILIIII